MRCACSRTGAIPTDRIATVCHRRTLADRTAVRWRGSARPIGCADRGASDRLRGSAGRPAASLLARGVGQRRRRRRRRRTVAAWLAGGDRPTVGATVNGRYGSAGTDRPAGSSRPLARRLRPLARATQNGRRLNRRPQRKTAAGWTDGRQLLFAISAVFIRPNYRSFFSVGRSI